MTLRSQEYDLPGNAKPHCSDNHLRKADVMDRPSVNAAGGDIPREYVVRRLYNCPSYDPFSGSACRRITRLALEDVNDHIETLKVRENRKTGRLEADDANLRRARDLLWCNSLLAALTPLEAISTEISKSNQHAAAIHAPSLVQGFLNILETRSEIL